MEILVTTFGRAINAGQRRIIAVNHVGQIGSMMEVDTLGGKQLHKRVNPGVGAPRPKDDLRVLPMEHHQVTSETVDESSQLRKGNVLATGDEGKNGVFHYLENV